MVVEQARVLKAEGKSNGHIARTLSISPSTVARAVPRLLYTFYIIFRVYKRILRTCGSG